MNDSDLSPALTTTTLKSTRTTSAVMSSPCRISWRDSDSSNRAAKFSAAAGAAVVVCVAVAIRGWSLSKRLTVAYARTLFLVCDGLVDQCPPGARRQKRAEDGVLSCALSGSLRRAYDRLRSAAVVRTR